MRRAPTWRCDTQEAPRLLPPPVQRETGLATIPPGLERIAQHSLDAGEVRTVALVVDTEHECDQTPLRPLPLRSVPRNLQQLGMVAPNQLGTERGERIFRGEVGVDASRIALD